MAEAIISRLLDELYCAKIVSSGWNSDNTAMMNAYVELRDDDTGRVQRARIVHPRGAFVGLAAGQSISWSAAGGRSRKLTVLRVSREPFEPQGNRAAE